MTYAEVDEFRHSTEPSDFASGWLLAQRADDVTSDYHMNLLSWTSASPGHVLGIVLNLIDRVGEDKATAEQIFLGPTTWLVEHAPDDFTPVLIDAVHEHPGFAFYTRIRESSDKPEWKRLNGDRTMRSSESLTAPDFCGNFCRDHASRAVMLPANPREL
jgi:hypothetical protein